MSASRVYERIMGDYPPMPDGPVRVERDGVDVSGTLTDADAAFRWLHRHQGQSVSHALNYEGYRVVSAR